MLKLFNKLLILVVISISKYTLALSSSSYLIANTAVNLFDFEEANIRMDFSYEYMSENDLFDQLLILVNIQSISRAAKVAEKILDINNFNQEAWAVKLVDAQLKKDTSVLLQYRKLRNNSEMDLLNFIFFNKDRKLQKNNIIANSIIDVVQNSLYNNKNNVSYEFLLFYLSIASILNPYSDEVFFYSGQIYETLENYTKAQFFYNKVNKSHILFVDSQINISIIKTKTGYFEEAETNLLNLISEFENIINFKFTLANLYRFQQDYNNAIIYYTEIIESQNNKFNDYWRFFYFRGICYEKLADWKTAEKDFLYSLKIKPDTPDVLNYLAYGWLERDIKIDQAMNMLIEAYKSNPNSYYILDSLAWAYFKKKQLDKALELMEKVILMAPGEAVSLDHLADIYFEINRKREAIFFWKQALDLANPEDMISDQIKIKLEKKNDS